LSKSVPWTLKLVELLILAPTRLEIDPLLLLLLATDVKVTGSVVVVVVVVVIDGLLESFLTEVIICFLLKLLFVFNDVDSLLMLLLLETVFVITMGF
jgi:hypothetical protein